MVPGGSLSPVANFIVAPDAGHFLRIPRYGIHHVLVAHATSLFGNHVIVGFDSERLGEVSRRESHGMPESVRSLGGVLRKEIRRRVAIVANRHITVAGFQPAAVVLTHDVAVGASRRVVGQIRRTASEHERIRAYTHGKTERHAHQYFRHEESCKAHTWNRWKPEHPYVAASLNNLAGLYDTQGKYAQAEPLYKRSLAISEKALGPEHPDVALSLKNYALLLRKMDRDAEAEKMEARAQAIRARHAQENPL